MFVRKCKICGKKFETDDRDQYICPEGHVSKCIICGRDIDIHKSGRPKKYCSTACRVEGRKLDALDHGYKRICELCGKEFYTLQKNKTICDDVHYFPCPICGKPVEYKDSNKERCCCREHTILKRKQTNQKIYGGNAPASSKAVVDKIKSTNLKRYGVEWKAQTDEFQQKRKATCLNKYGVPVSSQAESVKRKAEQTCMEHYGVKHAAQSEEIKRKTKEVFVEKYGVDNPMKCQQYKDKLKQTSLEKYGVDHPWKDAEVQEKRKQTWMDKYGVDNPGKCDTVKQKYRDTCLQRYGVDNPSNVPEIKEKIKLSQFAHYGTWYLDSEENRSNRSRPVSRRNLQFSDSLTAYNIEHEMESCFSDAKRRKFDFDITGTNVLVELDSTAVHNSYKHINNVPYTHEITDIQLNKSKLAWKHGKYCVHVFDWDNTDLVIKYLAPRKYNIPASFLSKITTDRMQCIKFFNDNNVQLVHNIEEYNSFVLLGVNDVPVYCIAYMQAANNNVRCSVCVANDYSVSDASAAVVKHCTLDGYISVVLDASKYIPVYGFDVSFDDLSSCTPIRVWSKASDVKRSDLEETETSESYCNRIQQAWLPVHTCGFVSVNVE